MKRVIVKRLAALALACALAPCVSAAAELSAKAADTYVIPTLRVDFADKTGIPLFKRQNLFAPSHSFGGEMATEFVRDTSLLRALDAESLRVDLFMGNGGIGAGLGAGSAQDMTASFMTTDAIFRQLYKNGTLPYVVYFATPYALFDRSAARSNFWRYPPADYEAWGRLCEEIAAHYRALGWPFAAHEIWNEPDWYDNAAGAMAFFAGSWEEYIRIYEYASKGIRRGDPYAAVGGLSLATFSKAYGDGRVNAFLDAVTEKALPLDFISYHCYDNADYRRYTQEANSALAAYGDTFAETGLHLNEFNVGLSASVTATEKCVAPMLDAICYFVETPQITSVNWACFRAASETNVQLIDSRAGKRFAAYHVLEFYNDMPVDRVRLDAADGIRGLASADGACCAALLYNRTWRQRSFTLELSGVPFGSVDVTVYGIDREHSNYGVNGGDDAAAVIYRAEGLSGSELRLKCELPSGAAMYVKLTPADAQEERTPPSQLTDGRALQGGTATVLRREYLFENRASTMFSEFDLASFTAWAGMGDADEGLSRGSVYLANVTDTLYAYPELTRSCGVLPNCFLTACYLDMQGEILAEQSFSARDGTLTPGETLYLRAPDGFDGVLRLTYGIESAGADQTLKIRFRGE
ncbi:MAG: hypothetical protein IKR85_01795 [Clostridia bacterium]|nr:hypothetical protein [Clostridia bacterium]